MHAPSSVPRDVGTACAPGGFWELGQLRLGPWHGCEREPGCRQGRRESAHRTVLALDAGAVETQGGHAVDRPLDVEDTLIASLARLRLGQVPSLQSDGLYLSDWYQDFLCGHQLGTVLGEQAERRHLS